MKKLPVRVAVPKPEDVGAKLANLTNKLFAIGQSVMDYASAVGTSYVEKLHVPTKEEVEARAIAEHVCAGGEYEGKLPNGLEVKIKDGELLEVK